MPSWSDLKLRFLLVDSKLIFIVSFDMLCSQNFLKWRMFCVVDSHVYYYKCDFINQIIMYNCDFINQIKMSKKSCSNMFLMKHHAVQFTKHHFFKTVSRKHLAIQCPINLNICFVRAQYSFYFKKTVYCCLTFMLF